MATLSNTTSSAANSANSTVDKAKSAINAGLSSMDMQQLEHLKDEAMDKASQYYEASTKYVRENPFYFMGGAALAGGVIGYLLARKK